MSNVSERNRGTLEMIAAMVLMGTVGYFVLEAGQSSYNVVFFRCLFGALFLALYCFYCGFFKNTGLTRKKLFMLALSGVVLVSNWVLLFSSFKFASISISTVVYHTQPLFFVIIGSIVLRERVTFTKMVWIMLAFVGVVWVADIDLASLSFSSTYLSGLLLALCAAVLYAIASIIVKQLKDIKPHLIAFIQVAAGMCVLLPFTDMQAMSSASATQWGYLVILGGVHTCLTYILMYSAFQKLPTPTIAVLSFIYPAVAILVDYVFYGKMLNTLQFAGIFLIMFSGFAVNQNISLMLRRKTE